MSDLNLQVGTDRIDARKLTEQLYMNKLKPVYHGEHGLRTLKELARSYLTITKDVTRVMNRLKEGKSSMFRANRRQDRKYR